MRQWDGLNGAKIIVSESDREPFDLVVSGQIQPVNCTIAINVTAHIQGAL